MASSSPPSWGGYLTHSRHTTHVFGIELNVYLPHQLQTRLYACHHRIAGRPQAWGISFRETTSRGGEPPGA